MQNCMPHSCLCASLATLKNIMLLSLWWHRVNMLPPHVRSWGEDIEGEMKTGERHGVGMEESERRGGDRHYVGSLTCQQWKVCEQQKWRLQTFWLSGCGNATDAVLLWLSVPACSHLFHELHLCNFLLEPCFLITSIIFVCVCVYGHAKNHHV